MDKAKSTIQKARGFNNFILSMTDVFSGLPVMAWFGCSFNVGEKDGRSVRRIEEDGQVRGIRKTVDRKEKGRNKGPKLLQ